MKIKEIQSACQSHIERDLIKKVQIAKTPVYFNWEAIKVFILFYLENNKKKTVGLEQINCV